MRDDSTGISVGDARVDHLPHIDVILHVVQRSVVRKDFQNLLDLLFRGLHAEILLRTAALARGPSSRGPLFQGRFKAQVVEKGSYLLGLLRYVALNPVESTFNWYWLVDGLRAKNFPALLVNTSAIQQYEGLERSDDQYDACGLDAGHQPASHRSCAPSMRSLDRSVSGTPCASGAQTPFPRGRHSSLDPDG